jgi:hypothetical protein
MTLRREPYCFSVLAISRQSGHSACVGGSNDWTRTRPDAVLARSGRSVDEVPVAHTPPGGYGDGFPGPILAGCREPLIAGAPDLRGVWRVVEVEAAGAIVSEHPALGHVQRVEQAADRMVVTGGGVIHDMRCDGTTEHGVRDVAEFDKQTSIIVVATYERGTHVLRPVGFAMEVTRKRDGPDMIWDYVGFRARLRRMGPPEMDPFA